MLINEPGYKFLVGPRVLKFSQFKTEDLTLKAITFSKEAGEIRRDFFQSYTLTYFPKFFQWACFYFNNDIYLYFKYKLNT